MTIVELKITSSLLLAEGVKPEGVLLCACARPASAATNNAELKYMFRSEETQRESRSVRG